ncbi:hypothetical protein R1T40_00745 [Tritonibacter scottomollicae]|uniref:Uncharacterized protein n=1 Tax=Tritonibacter scottomollicae TaxID=483013 RepID=A0ABZ0HE37_TRISK|nr:hypothetical protein [Tritonibacter scottomollicae]WOI32756.1 hypothetical protein R1T40_17690 [Tritonibacter scottomollicae]WOI33330.1 hypothetical protein R1T40_00745 [Tritonibacter scottomollicae]
MRTIAQTDLEARVLNALTNHLMDPEALAVFCETYADERNRLRREAEGARETLNAASPRPNAITKSWWTRLSQVFRRSRSKTG